MVGEAKGGRGWDRSHRWEWATLGLGDYDRDLDFTLCVSRFLLMSTEPPT